MGTKKRKMTHAKILFGFIRDSQLEAREAVTSKTNAKSVPEAYQARTKKPKLINSCTESQRTKIVKQETLPVMT